MGAGALPTTCLSNYTPRPCVAGVLLIFTSAFPETWSGCLLGSRIVSGRAGCLGRGVQRLVETTGVEEHSYNVLFSFKALSTLFLSRSTSYYKFVFRVLFTRRVRILIVIVFQPGPTFHASEPRYSHACRVLIFARASHLSRTRSQVRQSCHVIDPCDVITQVNTPECYLPSLLPRLLLIGC